MSSGPKGWPEYCSRTARWCREAAGPAQCRLPAGFLPRLLDTVALAGEVMFWTDTALVHGGECGQHGP